ncbi:MAG: NAD(P)-binding protein, partial [bacterium]
MNNFVIIGSGLGGLLAGYLLSKEGLEVTVLEKHKKFGGCLQSFRRDTFTFDTGMHYLGSLLPGQALYNYWKYFGLSDRLEFLPMDPDGFDRISFGDDDPLQNSQEFPLAQGLENFREQLLPYFPGSKKALKGYTDKLNEIALSHPLYNLELPSKQIPDIYRSIKASIFLDNLTSGIRHHCHCDPEYSGEAAASGISLSSVLAGNNFLYAGNPTTTPLHQFALINHSFISSACRVVGGSQQIADCLVAGIEHYGGRVLPKKKAVKIRKTGELFEVNSSDGDRFIASAVISDLHPAATLNLLEGIPVQKAFRSRINGLENTVSVFTV